MNAYWFRTSVSNFGDALTPFLVNELSGEMVEWCDPKDAKPPVYLVTGSVLDTPGLYLPSCEVWGAGLMFGTSRLASKPRAVHAVRGPLTREALVEQGIGCPEACGDPATILPLVWQRTVPPSHALGVAPHYVDWDEEWMIATRKTTKDVLVIDVRKPVPDVLRAIWSCHQIATSSLHALVAAHAYGVPALWVEFSQRVAGGGFKFRDYYASVGVRDVRPFVVEPTTSLSDLYRNVPHAAPPTGDLGERLLRACPFWRANK